MKFSLERLLKVRRQEQPLLLLMLGTIGLFQFCQILNENFAAAVFLKRYGVRYLPTTFFFNSLVFLVLILGLNRVVDRAARTRLVSLLLLGFAGVLVALRLLILSGVPLAYPVIYITVKQMKYVFYIVFWTLASDVYSTRKARRIFPIIGGGAVLGTVVGSMLSGGIAAITGTDNVVLFSAAGMLVSYLLVGLGRRQVDRLSPISFSPEEETTLSSMRAFFRRELLQLRGRSLLGYLMLLALLPGIVGPIFEYLFKYLANQTYASEASLLRFFGIFNGSYSILIMGCQVLFAGSLFRRFGIINILFAYPVGYLFAFVSLAIRFAMPAALVGNAGLEVIDAAFYKPGCQMLYNIIPAGLRGRVSALVQGAVRRLGELAGSGLLWGLTLAVSPATLTLVGPVFAVLWIACTYLLGRSYGAILYQSLSEKHVNFAELESRDLHSLIGSQTRETLSKSLASENAATALMAARLLIQADIPGWPGLVCEALPGRDAASQIDMLRAVASGPGREVAVALRCVCDRVSDAALPELASILRRVAPRDNVALFRTWLASGNARLAAESLLGLKAAGEKTDEGWALARLGSPKNDEVVSALYLVGELRNPASRARLYPFLESRETSVRSECARALGKLGLPASAEQWGPLLRDKEALVRLRAVEGLDALGEADAVRHVIPLLGDEDGAVREAARLLITRRGEDAIPIITAALSEAGLYARTVLIEILDGLGVKEQTLLGFIDGKVGEGYQAAMRMCAVGEAPLGKSREVVSLLFENRLGEAVYEIFRALGLLLKGSCTQFILESYRDRDESVREHALEALEHVLTPRLARRLLPLLEDLPLELTCAAGERHYGIERVDSDRVLEELLSSPGDADRLCGLMCVAEAREQRGQMLPQAVLERAAEEEKKLGMEGGRSVEELMEKVLTLKGVPIFSHMHFKELLAISSISRRETFQKGDRIITQGERGFSMYIITEGPVRITSRSDGEEVLLATLGPNDYFGEMALFDDSPRSASAVAAGAVGVLTIDKREFRDMLREYPGVSIMMCEEFCRRLRHTIEKVSV